MIPQQLKLRNFLSYGSHTQTIDFTDHHLICLSGKNGHGKSALLDAITWVLWGQARKVHATPKADEGLVCLGQDHMMVSLDFICNGKKYRVKREFTKHKTKATATLDFGIANDDGQTYSSLNEKTTRGTQEKITQVIGLDYESCVNSVFLRQGQSNEFSQKSAKERKEILATILGINRFEEQRKKAVEKARHALQAEEQLSRFATQLTEEINKKPLIEEELNHLTKAVAKRAQQEEEFLLKQKKLTRLEQELTEKSSAKKIKDFQLQHLAQTITEKSNTLITIRDQWRSLRRQRRQHITDYSPEKKVSLEQEEKKLEQLRTEQLQLKEQLLTAREQMSNLTQQLKKAHDEQTNKLVTEHNKQLVAHSTAQQKIETLEKQQIEQTALYEKHKKTCDVYTKTIACSQKLAHTLEKKQATFERKKTYYYKFTAKRNQLTLELNNLEQKQHLQEHIGAPSCPLCEQALSTKRKQFLQTKFARQKSFYTHQLERLKRSVPELKSILFDEHTELEHQRKELNEQMLCVQKKQELESTILLLAKELEALTTTLALQKKEATLVEAACKLAEKNVTEHSKNEAQIIRNNPEHQKLTLILDKLESKLSTSVYDPQKHEALKKELHSLREQSDKAADLLQQLSLQEERKKQIINLCAELKKQKAEQTAITKKLAHYVTLEKDRAALQDEQKKLQEQQQELGKAKEEFLQKKGALEQQIKLLQAREKELVDYQKQIATHQQNKEDYQDIAQALSKNGIQALLIENALPEIEHEANNLLGKLTDNQSHISIESLRDLKSGGTRETLDIKISDSLGIRPYELFSGGEAFRIDFALRIAISKLLARRSGTSLQTLIIDEGFGSQDEDGLNNIMEALYRIQDEFAKIIIVSHLATMKNQFPTHFIVHKGATGSSVTVMQQG